MVPSQCFPLAGALLVIVGCAGGVRHVRPAMAGLPTPEKAPLRLGLHIDEEFARAWAAHSVQGPIVAIGADSDAMLKELVPLLGERVELLSAPPPLAAGTPNVDLVLEPSLEHFDFFDWATRPAEVHHVVYRMTLFEPGGALVWSWTVEGRATVRPPPEPKRSANPSGPPVESGNSESEDGIAHATENLADAARRLVEGFRRDSRAEEYLTRRAAGEKLELEAMAVEASIEDVAMDLPGISRSGYAAGMAPLKVRIRNLGPSEVRLANVVARLELANGKRVHPLSPRRVGDRAALTSGAVAGRKASFGIIGGIAATAHGFELRSKLPLLRTKLENLALRPGTIPAGAAVEGFLFFLPESGTAPEGKATLFIWLGDETLRSARAAIELDLPARSVEKAPATEDEIR